MNRSTLPYKQLIFVCTNTREPGERISCAGEGRCGQMVLDKLKAYVKANHLEGEARVTKSGCQEKCELGPNVAVMPQNDFLSDVALTDVESIIRKYLFPLLTGGAKASSGVE
jgi:(2Fe-2S) ferredoxin